MKSSMFVHRLSFYAFPNTAFIGDFQGCHRVRNQRQVNGGQQKSSIDWLDCSTRRYALQKLSVSDWHLCMQEHRAHEWHMTCSSRRYALQKLLVWDWYFCVQEHSACDWHMTCSTRRHALQKILATSHMHYIGMHKNSSTIVLGCYEL